MDKYINVKDIEALVSRIDNNFDESAPSYHEEDEHSRKYYSRGWNDFKRRLFKALDQLTGIAVAPAGYYEWLLEKHGEDDYHKCSCCGAEYQILSPATFEDINKDVKRCPSCGAKMIKED